MRQVLKKNGTFANLKQPAPSEGGGVAKPAVSYAQPCQQQLCFALPTATAYCVRGNRTLQHTGAKGVV